MMFIFHIFTYAGDTQKLSYCLKALRKFDYCQIVVIDDIKNPINSGLIDRLLADGMIDDYRLSDRDRRGNLNGRDAVDMIVEEMRWSARYNQNAILVKLDTDTIVRDMEFLRIFAVSGCDFGGSDDRGAVYGALYFTTSTFLDTLSKEVAKLADDQINAEDMCLGAIARDHGDFYPVFIKKQADPYGNGPQGEMMAVDYARFWASLATARKASVVVCGNPLPDGVSGFKIIEAMKYLSL